jgi:hypothetical protein
MTQALDLDQPATDRKVNLAQLGRLYRRLLPPKVTDVIDGGLGV